MIEQSGTSLAWFQQGWTDQLEGIIVEHSFGACISTRTISCSESRSSVSNIIKNVGSALRFPRTFCSTPIALKLNVKKVRIKHLLSAYPVFCHVPDSSARIYFQHWLVRQPNHPIEPNEINSISLS